MGIKVATAHRGGIVLMDFLLYYGKNDTLTYTCY
jgi:hypothetical protein